ncbi:MAG: hypothetical protein ACI4IK_02960 [Eubacterium sp.]
MKEAIKRFKDIIETVEKDIAEAEAFKSDLYERYNSGGLDIEETIKIQSMVLKISDYVSQKRISKVELERQLAEYEDALESE